MMSVFKDFEFQRLIDLPLHVLLLAAIITVLWDTRLLRDDFDQLIERRAELKDVSSKSYDLLVSNNGYLFQNQQMISALDARIAKLEAGARCGQ